MVWFVCVFTVWCSRHNMIITRAICGEISLIYDDENYREILCETRLLQLLESTQALHRAAGIFQHT